MHLQTAKEPFHCSLALPFWALCDITKSCGGPHVNIMTNWHQWVYQMFGNLEREFSLLISSSLQNKRQQHNRCVLTWSVSAVRWISRSLRRSPHRDTQPNVLKQQEVDKKNNNNNNNSTSSLLQPWLSCIPANLSVPSHLHSPQQIHKSHSHYPAN